MRTEKQIRKEIRDLSSYIVANLKRTIDEVKKGYIQHSSVLLNTSLDDLMKVNQLEMEIIRLRQEDAEKAEFVQSTFDDFVKSHEVGEVLDGNFVSSVKTESGLEEVIKVSRKSK